MTVRRILVGNLITNCYLLIFSDRVAVIDPGDMPEKIEKFCNGLPITDLLLTHGHLDHTAAMGTLCDNYAPRVYLHKDDEDFLNDDALRAPGSAPNEHWRHDYKATHRISDGEILSLGNEEEAISLQVLHTPGHTPGSVCFYWKEQGVLFSGDTLFKGAEGRTDFPRSSFAQIKASLNKLAALPAETVVHPGHGFSTKLGEEAWIGEPLF